MDNVGPMMKSKIYKSYQQWMFGSMSMQHEEKINK